MKFYVKKEFGSKANLGSTSNFHQKIVGFKRRDQPKKWVLDTLKTLTRQHPDNFHTPSSSYQLLWLKYQSRWTLSGGQKGPSVAQRKIQVGAECCNMGSISKMFKLDHFSTLFKVGHLTHLCTDFVLVSQSSWNLFQNPKVILISILSIFPFLL